MMNCYSISLRINSVTQVAGMGQWQSHLTLSSSFQVFDSLGPNHLCMSTSTETHGGAHALNLHPYHR